VDNPKLASERSLQDQIIDDFDHIADKSLLLQVVLKRIDEHIDKIQTRIDDCKQDAYDKEWWAFKNWEEFKRDYDQNSCSDEDRHDIGYISQKMSIINELEEVLTTLKRKG